MKKVISKTVKPAIKTTVKKAVSKVTLTSNSTRVKRVTKSPVTLIKDKIETKT